MANVVTAEAEVNYSGKFRRGRKINFILATVLNKEKHKQTIIRGRKKKEEKNAASF